MMLTRSALPLAALACWMFLNLSDAGAWQEPASDASAAEQPAEKPGEAIELGEGQIKLTAPAAWEKKTPRVRIIDYEFMIPRAEGDPDDGRLTIMGAGGSVEANIDRWKDQFSQTDKAKVEKREIGGQEVHVVDLAGTYRDKPGGPFAPAPEKLLPDYRMLAAIIVTKGKGNYFIKLYGPQKTLEAHEKSFESLLKSLQVQ